MELHQPTPARESKKNASLLPFGIAAGLGAVAVLVGCSTQGAQNSAPAPAASTGGSTAASTPSTPATPGHYKDGTFAADGHYTSPQGPETIGISLTVASGKVTDVEVTTHPTGANTQTFQNRFAGGIKDEIVGKSLDDINVTRVSGSSLTPIGFMDALSQIKKEAS